MANTTEAEAALSVLAERANEAASLSRRAGAPRLTAESTRETLIAWLQWNDPNGSYTDELADIEGFDPMDLPTAWDALREMVESATPREVNAKCDTASGCRGAVHSPKCPEREF
jgi:hypothetical protein